MDRILHRGFNVLRHETQQAVRGRAARHGVVIVVEL